MNRQVRSRVDSSGYSRVQLDQLISLADQLNQTARQLTTLSSQWDLTRLGLIQKRSLALTCPSCGREPNQIGTHASFPFDQAEQTCATQSQTCLDLAGALSRQASSLTEAYSSYSITENLVQGMFSDLVGTITLMYPLQTILALVTGGLGVALSSVLTNETADSLPGVIEETSWLHQDFLRGLARRVAPAGSNPIGRIAEGVGLLVPLLVSKIQGERLDVQTVHPSGPGLQGANSISQALENLEILGRHDRGISYDTVAVQEYVDTDGSKRWVVYIPGTSSHRDSAIGWLQNIQLMSNRAHTRMEAASTRLVLETMHRAGVKPGDRVSLVGHSQGGIVAASLASDMADRYRFEHVITAGAPIANHPIRAQTQVTSIEMQEELVSSLDGADNPSKENRLTVRGQIDKSAPTPPVTSSARQARGAPGERGKSTHGMSYHRAAWQDSLDKGSPKVLGHDIHFAKVTQGKLLETTFCQGRIH